VGAAQSGNPCTRFAVTFSCTSLVPPSIELAFERDHCRVVFSSRSVKPVPSQSTAWVTIVSAVSGSFGSCVILCTIHQQVVYASS